MERMSIKRRSEIFLGAVFMFLVVTGSAWSFEIIYRGLNVVDFHFGSVCGSNLKCELYRGETLLWTWTETPEDIYFSDSQVPLDLPQYEYAFKRYLWDSTNKKWPTEPLTPTEEYLIDTWYVDGTLHNSADWQTKLHRGPVDWHSGNGMYKIKRVNIADGLLVITSGTDVVFLENNGITVSGDASLSAEGASFSQWESATNLVEIELQNQVPQLFETFKGCQIENIRITATNSKGVKIVNNTITKTPAYSYGDMVRLGFSNENIITDNSGNFEITVSSGGSNTIKNNTCLSVYAGTNDVIEGNTCDELRINGTATARKNVLKGLNIYGTNCIIEDNIINGGLYCSGCENVLIKENKIRNFEQYGIEISAGKSNTIEGNLIENKQMKYSESSAGIYLGSSDENIIKKNNILGIYGRGIHLYMAKKNSIEYNAINNSNLEGIFLENSYAACAANSPDGSNDNVIAFNHIWKNLYGIHADKDKGCHSGNGIHENIISTNGVGVKLGITNDCNIIYNNLFRGNNKNAEDDGNNNKWYHDKAPVNQNIVGGPWLAGNYWHDYTGTDGDDPKDGIGDTPYPIYNSSNPPVLKTNDMYPLKPLVSPDPDISLDKNAVTFDETPVGSSSGLQAVTVQNIGNADLVLWKIVVSGSNANNFSIRDDLCSHTTLKYNQTCTFNLLFSSAASGTWTAKAIITSNDAGTPDSEITLNGTATAPLVFQLSLASGWNFISPPVSSSSNDISTIFNDISSNVRVIWGFDNQNKAWKRWKPGASPESNSLKDFLSGKGYWVFMNVDATITTKGTAANNTLLSEGWNLVGYSGDDRDIAQGLGTDIDGKWIVIWGWENGNWRIKASDVNIQLPVLELTSLKKGKAYWIKVKQGMSAGWVQ